MDRKELQAIVTGAVKLSLKAQLDAATSLNMSMAGADSASYISRMLIKEALGNSEASRELARTLQEKD